MDLLEVAQAMFADRAGWMMRPSYSRRVGVPSRRVRAGTERRETHSVPTCRRTSTTSATTPSRSATSFDNTTVAIVEPRATVIAKSDGSFRDRPRPRDADQGDQEHVSGDGESGHAGETWQVGREHLSLLDRDHRAPLAEPDGAIIGALVKIVLVPARGRDDG